MVAKMSTVNIEAKFYCNYPHIPITCPSHFFDTVKRIPIGHVVETIIPQYENEQLITEGLSILSHNGILTGNLGFL